MKKLLKTFSQHLFMDDVGVANFLLVFCIQIWPNFYFLRVLPFSSLPI